LSKDKFKGNPYRRNIDRITFFINQAFLWIRNENAILSTFERAGLIPWRFIAKG